MTDRIKNLLAYLIPPKLYWLIVGKTNPLSSAIEGEYDERSFYKLGNYELNLFKKLGVIKKGYRTCEIGCGPGRIQKALVKYLKGDVYGTDISTSMISKAKKEVPDAIFSVGNGFNLVQYRDRFFDLVYAFVVFQHMDEHICKNYLRESYRILKNNGHLVFQIPSSENLSSYKRPVNHPWHLRKYQRDEVSDYLKKIGFKDIYVYDMSAKKNPRQVDERGFLFKCTK